MLSKMNYCTKSTHAIGQNQSRVFLLPGNNEPFECSIDNKAWKTIGGPKMTGNFCAPQAREAAYIVYIYLCSFKMSSKQ